MDIVEVVRHHNERVNPPQATHGRSPQVIHKAITIGVVTDNILPPVAAGHEVINRTGILHTQSSCLLLIATISSAGRKRIT